MCASTDGDPPVEAGQLESDSDSGVLWVEPPTCTNALPILSAELSGWTITNRRPTHWNAKRQVGGRELHLKWFFHSPRQNPAEREAKNAQRLAELGIPNVDVVGWGRHDQGSCLVLAAAPGTPLDEWRELGLTAPAWTMVAASLAEFVARLHDAKLCYRDLNVYHIFVSVSPNGAQLHLIDVGRVMSFRRRRWVIKDLATLLDSALREGLPQSACRAFFRAYLARTERRWRRSDLLQSVLRKAARYRRHNAKHGR